MGEGEREGKKDKKDRMKDFCRLSRERKKSGARGAAARFAARALLSSFFFLIEKVFQTSKRAPRARWSAQRPSRPPPFDTKEQKQTKLTGAGCWSGASARACRLHWSLSLPSRLHRRQRRCRFLPSRRSGARKCHRARSCRSSAATAFSAAWSSRGPIPVSQRRQKGTEASRGLRGRRVIEGERRKGEREGERGEENVRNKRARGLTAEKIVIKPERNRPPRGGDPAFIDPETMLGTQKKSTYGSSDGGWATRRAVEARRKAEVPRLPFGRAEAFACDLDGGDPPSRWPARRRRSSVRHKKRTTSSS